MALSADEIKRLMIMTTSTEVGNSMADAINAGEDLALQTVRALTLCVVATNVSQTIDFAALRVGDIVVRLQLAVSAAAVGFYTCAVAGTLPAAAVVGDLYIALRTRAVPVFPTERF